MRVGSLVEKVVNVCIHNPFAILDGCIEPSKGLIYTVRGIVNSTNDNPIILLEEIINPLCHNGKEYGYSIKSFREIQDPMTIDISELQHQTHTI